MHWQVPRLASGRPSFTRSSAFSGCADASNLYRQRFRRSPGPAVQSHLAPSSPGVHRMPGQDRHLMGNP